jgi:peptidyl-prolyl cis-trans isomerase D
MLKVLRENIKYLSWILWVIIALFVLFIFLDFGAGIGGVRGGGGSAAATVGHEKITQNEFQRVYKRTEDQVRQAYGAQYTPEMGKQLRLAARVLDELVTRHILLAEARRLGLQATDQEVRDQILADTTFKDESGRFVGDATYRRVLSQVGFTPESYETEVREQLLIQKLIDSLRSNLWVSDQEVERAYRDQVEKAKVKYLALPASQFAQAATVSDSDLAAYFNAHKEEFRQPEQREVAYVMVESAKLLPQVSADEAALRSYYEAHKQ